MHSKVGESIGEKVAAATGWTFMGVDPTPAPLGDVSIGAAMETYTGAKFGSSGTMTAALIITTAVKAVPVKQIGYSGLMVPVMEDKVLAKRWAEGTYNIDSCWPIRRFAARVSTRFRCPVMFPRSRSPGSGDVASLAWKWHKPLSARLLPVQGQEGRRHRPSSAISICSTRPCMPCLNTLRRSWRRRGGRGRAWCARLCGVARRHTASRSSPTAAAGDFWVEPPTLLSLGFEWRITGDDNRNARSTCTYRKKGEHALAQGAAAAAPAARVGHRAACPRDGSGEHFNHYIAPNMFAGSILNLEPDTEYECRFVLADPDGVKGKQEQTVTVRTRKEPQPAAGGHVYHVYPFGYKGPRQQPAFTGLLAAYYLGSDQSDHSREMPPRVQPGDTILVHAGVYKDNRFVYSGFDRTHRRLWHAVRRHLLPDAERHAGQAHRRSRPPATAKSSSTATAATISST